MPLQVLWHKIVEVVCGHTETPLVPEDVPREVAEMLLRMQFPAFCQNTVRRRALKAQSNATKPESPYHSSHAAS